MPNLPCPNPINCPGVDAPLANLSAELPDRRHFFGYSFFPDETMLCDVGTQELADICNLPIAYNFPLPVIYSSNAQTCTLDCGDGHSESYTVVGGTFISFDSQADADSQANAFACVLASILCSGGTINLFTNTPQNCTVNCPNGGIYTYTVDAGLFSALTQADADANAHAFACALAALLCAHLPPLPIPGEPTPIPASPIWANSPQACNFNCPDGSVSTYTVPGGLFFGTNLADANAKANAYACRQALLHRICLGDIPSTACADGLYSADISGTTSASASWSIISGSTPPGILFSNGFFVGFPIAGGTYAFTVQVRDGQSVAQKNYTIRVLEIMPDSLPDGDTAAPYAQALSTIGEQGSVVWSLSGGALPNGLTLNPNTGVISGTPTQSGTFDFTVQASET